MSTNSVSSIFTLKKSPTNCKKSSWKLSMKQNSFGKKSGSKSPTPTKSCRSCPGSTNTTTKSWRSTVRSNTTKSDKPWKSGCCSSSTSASCNWKATPGSSRMPLWTMTRSTTWRTPMLWTWNYTQTSPIRRWCRSPSTRRTSARSGTEAAVSSLWSIPPSSTSTISCCKTA